MEHGHPSRGRSPEENWLLYQQPSTVQAPKIGSSFTHLCWDFLWSSLVQVLCWQYHRCEFICLVAVLRPEDTGWQQRSMTSSSYSISTPSFKCFLSYVWQGVVLCVSFGVEHSTHHSFSVLSSAVGLCISSCQVQNEASLMRDESCTKLWLQREVCRRKFDIVYVQEAFYHRKIA